MYQVCWKYFLICSFSANLLKWLQQISDVEICIPMDILRKRRTTLRLAAENDVSVTSLWGEIRKKSTFVIFQLFDVEYYRNLEIHITGHSRSLKLVEFESLSTVSYSHSIVTMAVSCIISEVKWYIGRKFRFFYTPCFRRQRQGRFPSEYCHTVWYEETRMVWLPDGEKSLILCLAVST